jgi:hypothetical protein
MVSIYDMQFWELIYFKFWVLIFIKSKGIGAVMTIIYLTTLSSSLGGNIIKLFKFDYLQILSDLDLDIQF